MVNPLSDTGATIVKYAVRRELAVVIKLVMFHLAAPLRGVYTQASTLNRRRLLTDIFWRHWRCDIRTVGASVPCRLLRVLSCFPLQMLFRKGQPAYLPGIADDAGFIHNFRASLLLSGSLTDSFRVGEALCDNARHLCSRGIKRNGMLLFCAHLCAIWGFARHVLLLLNEAGGDKLLMKLPAAAKHGIIGACNGGTRVRHW